MRLLVQAHTEAGAALVIWLGLSLVTVPLAASCTQSGIQVMLNVELWFFLLNFSFFTLGVVPDLSVASPCQRPPAAGPAGGRVARSPGGRALAPSAAALPRRLLQPPGLRLGHLDTRARALAQEGGPGAQCGRHCR